ncbi:hypothetical protein ACO0RG_002511 [Hanseniaspora osmophila]
MDQILRKSFQYIKQNHQELDHELIDLSANLQFVKTPQSIITNTGIPCVSELLNSMKLTTWSCDLSNEVKKSKAKKTDRASKDSFNDYIMHENILHPDLYFPLPINFSQKNISGNNHYLIIYKAVPVGSERIDASNSSDFIDELEQNDTGRTKNDESKETYVTGYIDNFSVSAINSKYHNKNMEFVKYATLPIPVGYGSKIIDYSWAPITKEEEQERIGSNHGMQNNTFIINSDQMKNETQSHQKKTQFSQSKPFLPVSSNANKQNIQLLIVTDTHFLFYDLDNGGKLICKGKSLHEGIDLLRETRNMPKLETINNDENVFRDELLDSMLIKHADLNDFKTDPHCALWYKLYKKKSALTLMSSDFGSQMPQLAYNFDIKSSTANKNDQNDNATGVPYTSLSLLKAGNHTHSTLYFLAMQAMHGPLGFSNTDTLIGKSGDIFKNENFLFSKKPPVLNDFTLKLHNLNQKQEENQTNVFSNSMGTPSSNTTNSNTVCLDHLNSFIFQNVIENGDEDALVLDREISLFLTVLDDGLIILDIDSNFQVPIYLNLSALQSNANDNFGQNEQHNYQVKIYDSSTLLLYDENFIVACNISHLFENYLLMNMVESFTKLESLIAYWKEVLNVSIVKSFIQPFIKFFKNLCSAYNNEESNNRLMEELVELFCTGNYTTELKDWFVFSLGSKNTKKWTKLFNEMYDISVQLTMLNSCAERLLLEVDTFLANAKSFVTINQLTSLPTFILYTQKIKQELSNNILIPLNLMLNGSWKVEYQQHLDFLKWLTMWCLHMEDEDKPIHIVHPEKINSIMHFMTEVLPNLDSKKSDCSSLVLLEFQRQNSLHIATVENCIKIMKSYTASFMGVLVAQDMDYFEPLNETYQINDVSIINNSIHVIQSSEAENSLQIYDMEHDYLVIDLIKDLQEECTEDDNGYPGSNSNPIKRSPKHAAGKRRIKKAQFSNNKCTNSLTNNFDVDVLYE